VKHTTIRIEEAFRTAGRYRSGVSLHSHTLHSRESLDFVYPIARSFAPLQAALRLGEARYRRIHGAPLDFNRGWWTPPVAPHAAWQLEKSHIEDNLGLNALVSLTDHDDIEAPTTLRILEECRATPISVEWTVPYRGTFFHIGVHNLPPERARAIMAEFAAFTARAAEPKLVDLFAWLVSMPEILIVFNHPNWDEKGIGADLHRAAARQFIAAYSPFLHALELNGLRPWKENHTVLDLAKLFSKPLISGGDRHALEPNTMLNLTNAVTFSEFVAEIRGGFSDVLITRQYLEPFPLRFLQNIEDVLRDQEHHALGWRHWSDRVFFQGEDGCAQSLAQLWGNDRPLAARLFTQGVDLLRSLRLRHVFRLALAKSEEVVL